MGVSDGVSTAVDFADEEEETELEDIEDDLYFFDELDEDEAEDLLLLSVRVVYVACVFFLIFGFEDDLPESLLLLSLGFELCKSGSEEEDEGSGEEEDEEDGWGSGTLGAVKLPFATSPIKLTCAKRRLPEAVLLIIAPSSSGKERISRSSKRM